MPCPTLQAECIESTLHRRIEEDIGCNIPWMSATNSCRGIVNREYSETILNDLKEFREQLLLCLDPATSDCKVPCLETKIISRKLRSTRSLNGENYIRIRFKPLVEVTKNVSDYDEWNLIVELGSALGLWLGLSVINVFDNAITLIRNVFVFLCKKF